MQTQLCEKLYNSKSTINVKIPEYLSSCALVELKWLYGTIYWEHSAYWKESHTLPLIVAEYKYSYSCFAVTKAEGSHSTAIAGKC